MPAPWYEVVSPLGELGRPGAPGARQLDTLEGKTIAELSEKFFAD